MNGVPAAWLILAVLAVGAGPALSQPASVTEPVRACETRAGAPVRVAGTTLCFSGDIDRDSAGEAIRLLAGRALTAMVVTSNGGEVTAAVGLARAIRDRGLLLVVQRRCISSCANFLFPAARTKAVAPNALVIFETGIGLTHGRVHVRAGLDDQHGVNALLAADADTDDTGFLDAALGEQDLLDVLRENIQSLRSNDHLLLAAFDSESSG